MKLVRTEDGSGEYWAPHDAAGYDPQAVRILDNLGCPPDTIGWVEQPDIHGWYYFEAIGSLIHEATQAGHTIVFIGPDQ